MSPTRKPSVWSGRVHFRRAWARVVPPDAVAVPGRDATTVRSFPLAKTAVPASPSGLPLQGASDWRNETRGTRPSDRRLEGVDDTRPIGGGGAHRERGVAYSRRRCEADGAAASASGTATGCDRRRIT